jgi:hypothetical protein
MYYIIMPDNYHASLTTNINSVYTSTQRTNDLKTIKTIIDTNDLKDKSASYLTLNSALNERNLNMLDVMERDNQNVINQQNTLYILGTITTSTLLILAIMFGYDD